MSQNREMVSLRLDEKTREALKKKAVEIGSSQANALGVALGVYPADAFAKTEKRGNIITR